MSNQTAGHETELLTIAEAAELLRTPVAALRYRRHRNTGPRCFRLGRRLLYRRVTCTPGSTPSAAGRPPIADRPSGAPWPSVADGRIDPPRHSCSYR